MQDFHVRLTLRALHKTLGYHAQSTQPVTPDILLDIYQHLSLSNTTHVAFWAATVVSFFGFLRKSNLVPPSAKTFDPSRHLARRDLQLSEDILTIRLRYTKTIQFGERQLTLPLVRVPGSPLCPVSAVSLMFQRVPAPPSAPAFVFPCGRALWTLTHTSFVGYLRHFLQLAGHSPRKYSGHSFRKGGATFAATCSVPDHMIKFHGDWRSAAFERYITLPLSTRTSVTRAMAQKLAAHT